MADEKLNSGPEVQKTEEAPAPAVADPAHGEAAVPEHPPEQAGPANPGDVVISAEQIDALMAEKRQAARAEVEKAEASREQEAGAPAPEHPVAESKKAEKPRRGRPPKSDKTERPGPEAEKEPKKAGPRKGRPSKADKAAPDKAKPQPRDKMGLLIKCLFIYSERKKGSKKDAHRRLNRPRLCGQHKNAPNIGL